MVGNFPPYSPSHTEKTQQNVAEGTIDGLISVSGYTGSDSDQKGYPRMNELIGRKLGQYEITGVLGEGGMATVFRAYQTSVRRDVAIKIIESKLARNPEFVRRFEREAMTIAALDHPHILKIHDFGREDDLLYLVMELKSGGSLAHKIRAGQLSAQQVARYLDQISEALDHAHGKGIIHRDLKPQNVLLDTSDNTFLTDFGIAKLISGDSTALTAGGMAMGTPGYMAPEQWYGQQIDARTDLYALAGMVYEMLTGRVPFTGDTPATLMYQHLNEPPPPLHNLRADLPASLEKVLIKAMAKQPDQRYQSAGAFAAAFREGMTGTPPTENAQEATVPPTSLPPITPLSALETSVDLPKSASRDASRRGGRGFTMLVGMAALALIVIGAIVLIGRGGEQITPTNTSVTEPVIAANPTQTVTPRATSTFTPSVRASTVPSLTVTASKTATVLPTISLTPSMVSPNARTQLANANATQTERAAHASVTPTPPILTPTLDRRTVRANAYATQTKRAIDAAPSRTPTFTKTPTVMPQPTSVMNGKDGAVRLLREDFDDKEAITKRGWYSAGEIKPIFVPGQITVQNPAPKVWGSIFHPNTLGAKANGVLYLFKPVSNAGVITFTLDSGTWRQTDFRGWHFDKEGGTNLWHFSYLYGRNAGVDPEYHEAAAVRLAPDHWYYLVMWVNERGEGVIKVWQAGSKTYLLNTSLMPIGSNWIAREWSTAAEVYDRAKDALFIDTFEILSFPKSAAVQATLIPAGASTFGWKPIEREFHGVSMVLVPAGCFQMGSNDGKADQQPMHEVCLTKSFWISKVEVTNASYRRFVIAGGYQTRNYWTAEGWAWKGSRTGPQNCGNDFGASTQPRVCISWYEAQAFAAWWGGRLPTEAEWEYAARGPQGSIYPWGNYFVDSRVVFQGNSGGKPALVGSLPAGKSWVGALDMGGNVWEWVRDWYDEDYYKLSPKNDPQGGTTGAKRVMRGGAWNNLSEVAFRTTFRDQLDPSIQYNNRGLRLVREY